MRLQNKHEPLQARTPNGKSLNMKICTKKGMKKKKTKRANKKPYICLVFSYMTSITFKIPVKFSIFDEYFCVMHKRYSASSNSVNFRGGFWFLQLCKLLFKINGEKSITKWSTFTQLLILFSSPMLSMMPWIWPFLALKETSDLNSEPHWTRLRSWFANFGRWTSLRW